MQKEKISTGIYQIKTFYFFAAIAALAAANLASGTLNGEQDTYVRFNSWLARGIIIFDFTDLPSLATVLGY